MSRSEINIDQTEMQQCVIQMKSSLNAWDNSVAMIPFSGIVIKSKGHSATTLEQCFERAQQLTCALRTLQEKTIQAFGRAEETYLEADSSAAKSISSK